MRSFLMSQKNILIVDDEAILARALELKLQKVGFGVFVVNNGLQAIEAIKKQSFDLILLDILMPEMDGWEVLSALKGKGLKIIVTSNLGQLEDISKAKTLGAIDFLVKSNTSLSQIQEKIQGFLID